MKPAAARGGTWLALSTKTNKIAVLLNIVQVTHPDPNRKGRGQYVITQPSIADYYNVEKNITIDYRQILSLKYPLSFTGCLVTKFITNDASAEEHLKDLDAHADEYNPFNLVVFEQT